MTDRAWFSRLMTSGLETERVGSYNAGAFTGAYPVKFGVTTSEEVTKQKGQSDTPCTLYKQDYRNHTAKLSDSITVIIS